MSAPVLTVSDLTVAFASREGPVPVVNGVDFAIRPGEVLAILGESGSGKSVSLRALVGMLPRRSTSIGGRIDYKARDLVPLSEREMADICGPGISMVFQEPMTALDPVFTIGQQIAETMRRHEGVSRRDAMARARDLLDMVKIPSPERRLRAYPHELSGGMRQRAMIALALSCRPDVLLADEPTTALDVSVQIQIILLLRELQKELGMGVIFVTHDVGVAAEIADRIAVMYAGRFVETGSAVDVIETPRHPYTAGLLSSTVHGSMRGRRLTAIAGMPPDPRAIPAGCPFAPRCPHMVARCTEPPIESAEVAPGHATRCVRVAAGELALDPHIMA